MTYVCSLAQQRYDTLVQRKLDFLSLHEFQQP